MATTNTGFDPLASDQSAVIVYVDLKSPYAFIAKDPTRALEQELGISFDWRPLTLNIPSYLGSARLDKRSGKVAQAKRSKDQWGAVKYAYRDARRYAALQGYALRGTEKIWDTSLVHRAFSWVKLKGPERLADFLDQAYPPFWQRALDVEDLPVIVQLLKASGVPTEGFEAWASGPGLEAHEQEQQAIFAAGIYGVPSYVHKGEFWFGREHLDLLRHRLLGSSGPEPDIRYGYLQGQARQPPTAQTTLEPVKDFEVQLDLREPQSYLGLEATLQLCEALDRWPRLLPFEAGPSTAPPSTPLPSDRPGQHRYHRDHYRARALLTQAQALGLRIDRRYEQPTLERLHHAWLWAEAQQQPQALAQWLRTVFKAYWEQQSSPNDATGLEASLSAAGFDGTRWRAQLTAAGSLDDTELKTVHERLSEANGRAVFEGPRYLLDGEPYSGRVHLPLVRERLRQPLPAGGT